MDRSRDHLVSLEQAAQRANTSYRTIRRRILDGELTVYMDARDRRRRLVSVDEIDHVFQPRRIEAREAA